MRLEIRVKCNVRGISSGFVRYLEVDCKLGFECLVIRVKREISLCFVFFKIFRMVYGGFGVFVYCF